MRHMTRLRNNWVFVLLLVAGAVLRVVVVLAYEPVFMLQKDTYAYLAAAMAEGVEPSSFRPLLYSLLFLKPVLLTDSLMAVAIAQHVLGMVLSILLYACLRRLSVAPVLASLGVAPLLLDGYQLVIEHYLLAEAFFQTLVVGALLVLVWWRRSTVAVVVAGLLVGLSGLTRFVGLVLVAPALVYAAMARIGWLRSAALVVAFAVPLSVYGLWNSSSSGTFGLTNRNGFFLYGRVSSFADCSEMDPPRALRRFCLRTPPEERGPNYGIFALPGVSVQELAEIPDVNRKLTSFSTRAIAAQPLQYAQTVIADLARFFAPTPPPSQEPYVRRWRFPRSLGDARPRPVIVRRGGSAPVRFGFQGFDIDRSLASLLRSYQSFVYTPGPLLALFLLAGLAGSLVGARDERERLLRAACLLFTTSALVLLVAPVMTTVYHFRYVLAAVPLLGPAGAMGTTMCARFVSRRISARRGRSPSP
jgi:hypothetical protein